MVTMGVFPFQGKNAHGRAGNRTRDLMVISQELWPPSHEAGNGEPNIVIVLKPSRLRWAGHVVRMDDKELPKKILWANPGGQRGSGRLKWRLINGVEEDSRKVGCRKWRADVAGDICLRGEDPHRAVGPMMMIMMMMTFFSMWQPFSVHRKSDV